MDLLPKNQDLLEPLEKVTSLLIIVVIAERDGNQADRDILALLVRLGGACVLQMYALKQFGNPLDQSK